MTVQYRKTRLENGIRIVSENMDTVRSVSVGVWMFTGTRNEPRRLNGISHLLEHMAFKGTSNRSAYDIAVSLESLGGHLNAFTEKEFTCFCALVLDEHLEQAVDVIADIVQHPLLTESDLKSEKRIVSEEIRNLEDTPEDLIHDLFLQTVFDDHPMGFPILGTEESLHAIRRKDLVRYRTLHYTCRNCIVTAAGHLDHDGLVRMTEERFGHLSRQKSPKSPKTKRGNTLRRVKPSPIAQTHLCTGIPGVDYNDLRKFALIVLDTYFGGGMSSRLFQNLREKSGLAYSVYSFLDFWSDTGLWGVYTGTSPETSGRAFDIIQKEYDRLGRSGVSEADLKRVKSQIVGNLLLMFEDTGHRMNRLAKMEAYTQAYTPIDDVIEKIRSVSRKDIRSVVEALLEGKERYTVVLEPGEAD
jgi:predicted Zn-dependent peptidase